MRILNLLIILVLFSCKGQKCGDENDAIKAISSLPEIKKQQKHIDSITNHKHGVSYIVENEKTDREEYFRIKTGYNGELHWETYYIFYVSKNDCTKIFIEDKNIGDKIPIEIWQKTNKKKVKMINKIKFSDLFNEGSNITFTPNDINNNEQNIKDFKNKLISFENTNPNSDDFGDDDLSLLINNETFTNNESYINSKWLNYFIVKYKIDSNKLYYLMDLAINREDYEAVKILNSYCIISLSQIKQIQQKIKYKESLHGKIDVENYYDPSYSKIKEIYNILNISYLSNKIIDPDGYTNLRKDKNTSSEILQKVKSGENIDVLDNSGDWFLVKTKEGKQGYIHKSRLKSE